MTLPKIRYSRLQFYHFVDAEDQEMGTLEDVILDPNTLEPSHLLLGGGFFEEYMESKGEIDDIDELAPLEIVHHIDNDYIVLSKQLSELETTTKDGKLPISGFKYSEFIKFPLSDQNGPIDADIFDYEFDYGKSHIILRHRELQPKLHQLGYLQKIELHIPLSYVSVNDTTIHFSFTLDELIEEVTNMVEPKQIGKSKVYLSQ